MKFFVLSALLAATVQAVAIPQQLDARAATTVRIMPFGASIVGAPGCWRALLWQKLQAAGLTNTDFVGTRSAPDCGFPYDGENEGHSGSFAVDWVKNGDFPQKLAAAKPDVIVMHLGTNDVVIGKKTPAEIITAYGVLVDQMRASKKSMQIIISLLIPLDPVRYGTEAQQGIVALNKAIQKWAPTKSTLNSPITIVDNHSGFNVATDTHDGEHPNDAGNRKLADKFYGPVSTAIRTVHAVCPPWVYCLDCSAGTCRRVED